MLKNFQLRSLMQEGFPCKSQFYRKKGGSKIPKFSHASSNCCCNGKPAASLHCTYVRENFHQSSSNLVVFASVEETCRFSLMSNAPCSSYSVYKLFNFRWQIKVNDMFNIINVKSTGCNIGSNKYWASSFLEISQSLLSFLL